MSRPIHRAGREQGEGSKFKKDFPGLIYEANLDESQDLESFSAEPTCAPHGSDSDIEVQSTSFKAVVTSETAEARQTSLGSRSDGRLVEIAPVIDKPLELKDYQGEDLSSPVPWVSHGDVVTENSSLGSSSSSTFEDVHTEIGEGFDRVRELVEELFSVDYSFNEIEANAQFVHRLLRNLSDEVTDNWGKCGNEGLREEYAASVDLMKLQKEACVTKCDAKRAHLDQVEDSLEADTEPVTLPHEKSPMKTDCPTTISTSSTLASLTSNIADSVERESFLSQTCCSFKASSSNPITSPGEPAITEAKAGEKSKYEMIREDIIAERNAQLIAMGFFEEFAMLRSDMNPKKKQKKQKKQPKIKDIFENNQIRRSERLFLSSPEVDNMLDIKKATNNVVEDVIADIIYAASQDKALQIPALVLKCPECGKMFKRRKYMLRHFRLVHGKLLTIHCEHCDFKTNSNQLSIKHMVRRHSCITSMTDKMSPHDANSINKVCCCDECDFKAKNSKVLTEHKCQAHGGTEDEFKVIGCDQCHYVTTIKKNLSKHKLRVHERRDQLHKCDQCNYVSQYKSNFQRHQTAYHSGEKKFDGIPIEGIDGKLHRCNQCNFVTTHRGTFTSHKTRHHGKEILKPEVLKAGSSSADVVDSDLESVEIFTDDSDEEVDDTSVEKAEDTVKGVNKVKSGQKWFCDICGKVLSCRSNLKRHTRTVHEISYV